MRLGFRRRQSRFHGISILVLAGVAACASGKTKPSYTDAAALPPHLADPVRHPHPECPPSQGLPAVGRSLGSPDEARARALAGVAANVSSRVEGVIRDQQKLVIAQGQATSTTTLVQDITQRSAFSHAELVRIVGGTEKHGDEWFALACLDRARAATTLDDEAAAPLQVLGLAVERARAAAKSQDAAAFTTARAEGFEAAGQALPLLAQRRVILDDPAIHARMTTLQANIGALRELSSDLRGKVHVVLAVDAPRMPEAARTALVERVRGAIGGRRVPVSLQQEPGCTDGASHALTLRADPACKWGSLGHSCKPVIDLKAEVCATRAGLFNSPFPGPLKGSSTQAEEQALERAMRGFDDAAVAQWLAPLLREVGAE